MQKEFFEKVEKNDASGLTQLISESASSIDVKDGSGYSLLHRSITKGFDMISNVLIQNGINLNAQDKNGQTALHYVAFYGNIEIAKILLDKNADLHIADIYGNQPLWTAVFNDKGFGKRLDIIKAFVASGADIDHKNKAGKSPLEFAVSANYPAISQLLSQTNR